MAGVTRRGPLWALVLAAGLAGGVGLGVAACAARPGAAGVRPVASVKPPTLSDTTPMDLPGLHNVVAYHEHYYSGSVPEGDAGFDTLQGMGVRTIISVDGMEPDLALAKAHGMRYIHLPIGYNGFDEERKLQLARATRDAIKDGPVYVHCHHGKHRSAGAAAAVASTLGWSTPQQGVERMRVSGTAAGYTGLYRCAMESVVVSAAVLDSVSPDFPEVSRPANFVKTMVEIDEVFDRLSDIERAGWAVPADHPDLVPVAEAARLVDLFRVAGTSEEAGRKPADFAEMFRNDQARAQQLEDWIAAGNPPKDQLSATFKQIGASCRACHVAHRDKAPW